MTGVPPITYVSVQSQPEINQGTRQMLTEIVLRAGSFLFLCGFSGFPDFLLWSDFGDRETKCYFTHRVRWCLLAPEVIHHFFPLFFT